MLRCRQDDDPFDDANGLTSHSFSTSLLALVIRLYCISHPSHPSHPSYIRPPPSCFRLLFVAILSHFIDAAMRTRQRKPEADGWHVTEQCRGRISRTGNALAQVAVGAVGGVGAGFGWSDRHLSIRGHRWRSRCYLCALTCSIYYHQCPRPRTMATRLSWCKSFPMRL